MNHRRNFMRLSVSILVHAQTKRPTVWHIGTEMLEWSFEKSLKRHFQKSIWISIKIYDYLKKTVIFGHAIRSITGHFWTNASLYIYVCIFVVVVEKTSFSLRYHCQFVAMRQCKVCLSICLSIWSVFSWLYQMNIFKLHCFAQFCVSLAYALLVYFGHGKTI